MNNLHRELAPVSDAAWTEIADEAARTFRRHLAGRRVVDVQGPAGESLSAVGTGHIREIEPPDDGVLARQRHVLSLVELRVPFSLDREQVDDVARGARDSDWQPVKDAARQLAFAEDRAIFDGYAAADIDGIRPAASTPTIALPANATAYPVAVAQALSELRSAGVNGPYSVVLSAEAYTAASETSDHGYPVIEHLRRLISDEIVWAPAIEGGLVLTRRGGDFELQLGQDASIGYLSHTETSVRLYLQESLTFLMLTSEAAVPLTPSAS
ncbi:MAG: family 1 encapsulin nanocompartment shell protein [Streptosporangiaceae bacterium]